MSWIYLVLSIYMYNNIFSSHYCIQDLVQQWLLLFLQHHLLHLVCTLAMLQSSSRIPFTSIHSLTADFITPSQLNATVEQQIVHFHCQHRSSDDITWRVIGIPLSSSNISIEKFLPVVVALGLLYLSVHSLATIQQQLRVWQYSLMHLLFNLQHL